MNAKKVPQLFVATGAHQMGRSGAFPWTMGLKPELPRPRRAIYAQYLLKNKPNAKIGVLYQNDDYGKDY